jgi:hypothetical protein
MAELSSADENDVELDSSEEDEDELHSLTVTDEHSETENAGVEGSNSKRKKDVI